MNLPYHSVFTSLNIQNRQNKLGWGGGSVDKVVARVLSTITGPCLKHTSTRISERPVKQEIGKHHSKTNKMRGINTVLLIILLIVWSHFYNQNTDNSLNFKEGFVATKKHTTRHHKKTNSLGLKDGER